MGPPMRPDFRPLKVFAASVMLLFVAVVAVWQGQFGLTW